MSLLRRISIRLRISTDVSRRILTYLDVSQFGYSHPAFLLWRYFADIFIKKDLNRGSDNYHKEG